MRVVVCGTVASAEAAASADAAATVVNGVQRCLIVQSYCVRLLSNFQLTAKASLVVRVTS